jgi:hypothetical protein
MHDGTTRREVVEGRVLANSGKRDAVEAVEISDAETA